MVKGRNLDTRLMQSFLTLNMCTMAFCVHVDVFELMLAFDSATLVLRVTADHLAVVARSSIVYLWSELELRFVVRTLFQVVIY